MSELAVGSLKGLAANSFVIDIAAGSTLNVPPPAIIAVKHAMFTGIQDASVAAGANFAVTDLSITHALADSGNRLIISAFMGAVADTALRAQVGIAVHDGTGLIAVGDSAGSRTSVTAGGPTDQAGGDRVVTNPSVTFVHTPGDTDSRTYTVRAVHINSVTSTVFINRGQADSDGLQSPRAVSSLVIQEVAV